MNDIFHDIDDRISGFTCISCRARKIEFMCKECLNEKSMKSIFYERDLVESRSQRREKSKDILSQINITKRSNLEILIHRNSHRNIQLLQLKTYKILLEKEKNELRSKINGIKDDIKTHLSFSMSLKSKKLDDIDDSIAYKERSRKTIELFEILGISLHDTSISTHSYSKILNIPIPRDGNYYKLPMDHLNFAIELMARLSYWIAKYMGISLPLPIDTNHPLVHLDSLYPYIIQLSKYKQETIILNDKTNDLVPLSYAKSDNDIYYRYKLSYDENEPYPFEWLLALSMLNYDVGYLLYILTNIKFKHISEFNSSLENLYRICSFMNRDRIDYNTDWPWSLSDVIQSTLEFYKLCNKDSRSYQLSMLDDVDWTVITS